jgi:hypothetical protein
MFSARKARQHLKGKFGVPPQELVWHCKIFSEATVWHSSIKYIRLNCRGEIVSNSQQRQAS